MQSGMKTNSAHPSLLTTNGHARFCVILSTSSGIEVSVNEEKISNTNQIYYHVKRPRRTLAPLFTERAQVEPLSR